MPPRDSRRQRLYDWERANVPGWQEGEWVPVPVKRFKDATGKEHVFHTQRCRIPDEMPLAACALLVHRVWADYHPGWTPPRVTPGHLARKATGSRSRINLPRWARQVPVALHELAHGLTPGRTHLAAHGPEFIRLYIELLVRYWTRHPLCRQAMQDQGITNLRQHLLTTARTAGLKIARGL